jgi:hypothetical protein
MRLYVTILILQRLLICCIVSTKPSQKKQNQKQYVKFTDTGKETKFIAQLCRNTITKVNIAFKTTNSVEKSLKMKHPIYSNKYFNPSVCQLACSECAEQHVGKSVEIS